MPRPGAAFWLSYTRLLCGNCTHGREAPQASVKDVTKVFESAVQAHGRDTVDLWLQWIEFMRECRQDTAAIASRAVRTLAPELADAFSLRLHEQLG